MDTVSVIIVDDHAVVRSGLRLLVEQAEGLECVGDYPAHEDCLPYLERLEPDVVVMDLETPGAGGLAGTEAVLSRRPEARVLVLSMHESRDVIRRAFAVGAAGYVAKAAADDDLIDAIRVVADGGQYLDPTLGATVLGPAGESPVDRLSDREQEVLTKLALGYTNLEISEALYVSVRTVESHRAHIMSKLGATSKAAMVLAALRAGLLDDARRQDGNA